MNEIDFLPLQYPDPWPPPGIHPTDEPKQTLNQIPIVGRLIRYIRWLNQSRTYLRDVGYPIEEQIVEQLNARPNHGVWPSSADKCEIACIISRAVRNEKGLDVVPALHPEDPFSLLFWGPFDDITPLIVRTELQKQHQIRLPSDTFLLAWKEDWTIEKFVDFCLEQK